MKNKILFFPTYMTTPIFETELELMKESLNQWSKVYVIKCNWWLKKCLNKTDNWLKWKINCFMCKNTFKKGIQMVKSNNLEIINLKKIKYKYNSDIKDISTIEELKNINYKWINIGISIVSTIIFQLKNRDHGFNVNENQRNIIEYIDTYKYLYDNLSKIISNIMPTTWYIFNGRFFTNDVFIKLFQKSEIPFFTHERWADMNKYLLRNWVLPHDINENTKEIYELWKNWDINKIDIANSYFEERRKSIIRSWTSFTDKQKTWKLPENFSKRQTNITIFNSTIEEYASIPWWENLLYKDENDWIEKILESFQNETNIHFYIRIHPNLKWLDNTQARKLSEIWKKYSNCTIINPEDSVSSYTLLDNSAKIITFWSTIWVEWTYWNIPVILLWRALYEKLDVAYIPKNHEETIDLIRKKLLPKNKENTLPYWFWDLTKWNQFKYYQPKDLFNWVFLWANIVPTINKVVIYIYKKLKKYV